MSTTRGPIAQSTKETLIHTFDFTNDLVTGVSVSTAVATITDPAGASTALASNKITVQSPYVNVKYGPPTKLGDHLLDCVATLSDGQAAHIRLMIGVGY